MLRTSPNKILTKLLKIKKELAVLSKIKQVVGFAEILYWALSNKKFKSSKIHKLLWINL